MSKKPVPTWEYQNSRELYSCVLLDARENLASQARTKIISQYDWATHTRREVEVFDESSFNNLIDNKYQELRGIYSIPIHFEDFKSFIYRHSRVYKWARYGHFARLHNGRIGRYRRYRHPAGQSYGQYYRYGESFVQHGIKTKEEPVSDMYQVNPEEARLDWRKKKGFARDQGKGRCFCKCNLNDGRPRRRWERDQIRKGNWDLHTDKNQFTNRWNCC